jgi:hypothetical protein
MKPEADIPYRLAATHLLDYPKEHAVPLGFRPIKVIAFDFSVQTWPGVSEVEFVLCASTDRTRHASAPWAQGRI